MHIQHPLLTVPIKRQSRGVHHEYSTAVAYAYTVSKHTHRVYMVAEIKALRVPLLMRKPGKPKSFLVLLDTCILIAISPPEVWAIKNGISGCCSLMFPVLIGKLQWSALAWRICDV